MDILRFRWVQKAVRKSYPDSIQIIFLIIFFVILIIGAKGSTFSSRNPMTYLIWTVWWSFLPLVLFLSARAWCGICPLGTWGDIIGKIRKFQRPKPPSFLLKYGIWITVGTFLLITWLDWGLGVTGNPGLTFFLFIAFLFFAGVFSLFYHGRLFCKSICPLNPLIRLYASSSVLEYRGKGVKVQNSFKCPMYISPVYIQNNKDCILCFQCLRKKEKGEYNLSLRFPGRELIDGFKLYRGESAFLLILAPLVFLQAFQMTKIYPKVMKTIFLVTPFKNYYIAFTFLFIGLIIFFAILYLVFKGVQKLVYKENFEFLFFSLPIILSLHLFHSVLHITSDFRERLGLNPPGREWLEIGIPLKIVGGLILLLGLLWAFYLLAKRFSSSHKIGVPTLFLGSVFIFYFILLFMSMGLSHIH